PAALELAATAAYLTGRREESVGLWTRAHHDLLARGEVRRAARAAFWLGFQLFQGGDRARGGGWMARAGRLLEEQADDCVESGYLLIPAGLGAMSGGKPDVARETFARAGEIAA